MENLRVFNSGLNRNWQVNHIGEIDPSEQLKEVDRNQIKEMICWVIIYENQALKEVRFHLFPSLSFCAHPLLFTS